MKKALRETQTLRAGCSKAEPIIFATPQTPSRGRGTPQNLISWRTEFGEDRYKQIRVIVVAGPQTHTHTHTHTHTPPARCKHSHRQDR